MKREEGGPDQTLAYHAPGKAPASQKRDLQRRWGVIVGAFLMFGGAAVRPLMETQVISMIMITSGVVILYFTMAYTRIRQFSSKFSDTDVDEEWSLTEERKKELLRVAETVHERFPIGRWREIDATLRYYGASVVHQERTLEIYADATGVYRRYTGGDDPRASEIHFRIWQEEAHDSAEASGQRSEVHASKRWPRLFEVELVSPKQEGRYLVFFEFEVHRSPDNEPRLLLLLQSKIPVSTEWCEFWPFAGRYLQSA
jgi:hypothetical protein